MFLIIQFDKSLLDGFLIIMTKLITNGNVKVCTSFKTHNQGNTEGHAAPAHFNGGRDCTTFMGAALPQGIFVCGDHMVSIQPRNMIFYCSLLLFDLRFSLGYCNTERSYRKWQKRWSSSSNWTIKYIEYKSIMFHRFYI